MTIFNFSDKTPTVQQIKETGMIFVTITKENVLKKDYTRLNELHKVLLKTGTNGKEKVILLFGGYDDDPREIYLIDEIKSYVKELIKNKPDIFYWLTSFDNNKQMVLLCAIDTMTMVSLIKDKSKIANSFEVPKQLYEDIIHGTSILCSMIGETPEEFERIIIQLTQPGNNI